MSRIKGCVVRKDILPAEHCGDIDGLFYVEEIPKNAIKGESLVYPHDSFPPTWGMVKVPAELIGKKVSFIIIPEEDYVNIKN